MKPFKLAKNTDSVDIDDKSLGISAYGEGDLNNNRGLKIQIRHNGDKATFERANELSRLIFAGPEMLAVLKQLHAEILEQGNEGDAANASLLYRVIAKAEGRDHE